MELSKADKKAASEIIKIGMQNEFRQGLLEAAAVIKEWEQKAGENQAYYQLLYSTIVGFDKHIARRYNGMSGSKYLLIIAGQWADKMITEDDLQKLTPDVVDRIKAMCE